MINLGADRSIEITAGTPLIFDVPASATSAPVLHEATPAWRAVLPWLSFWIVMGLSFWLTIWLADESRLPNYVWYVMAQVNVLLIVFFEQLIPKSSENSLFRDGQVWNDIGHMLLVKLVWGLSVWITALSIVTFSANHWHNREGIWPSSLPVPVQFLLLLLTFDLVGYACHRILHRFNFLRAFHALHHDTRKMHVLKSNRFHFGESVMGVLFIVPVMVVVGCPPAMVIWLGMWVVFEGNLAHSNIDQRFPHWFHYIVRTADVHHVHHSDDGKLQNSNFGGLPLWDIIFRTYRHPFDTPVTTTGINGDPIPKGFFAQLLFPFIAVFCARVVAPLPAAGESKARLRCKK